MKKSVKKVIQWVDDKLEVFIGAVFLALMVVFTTLQIVGRYLFSTPFPWTEEMTRYGVHLHRLCGKDRGTYKDNICAFLTQAGPETVSGYFM